MRRLIPDTFFARLFVLFFFGLIASHLLGSAVFFNLAPQPPRPPFGPHGGTHMRPHPGNDEARPQAPGEQPHPPRATDEAGNNDARPDAAAGGNEGNRLQSSLSEPPPEFRFPPRMRRSPWLDHPILWLDPLIRLLVLALTAWIGARWLARPMRQLSDAAAALGNDLQSPPLQLAGPAELRRTADAFNRMQAQLKSQIDERSRFLAAVSHDLRTPLTRLRLRCEAIEPLALRERAQQDLSDMNAMLTATLDYLRGQAQPEARQLLDVGALVHSLAEDLQQDDARIVVSGQVAALPAQPLALKRCLSNLLENAQRYGHGATVRLIDSAGACTIEIEDIGPGLPPEQLEAVFAPFYRLEDSRNRQTGGVGLGLSIARDVALRHGGTLTLSNALPHGLIATLILPRP
ncbi:Osmolarity sensor protein EnvZ [Andreprevotia sp. IGB-42]|uniref:ATP-binding protein n=1 Tax=Andreprevotia sp. IGB-42 TaxID=2497473 RepID=UPI00135CAEDB|nr:ATP-binding protein [Andreprevotia sp. IGB-42]KAF0813155.1 Osmolarity sensor protein EnvZ [Andreprevotia sp. IGB-42]